MNTDNRPGAIICPNCGKLINANARECIHCGYKNPGKKNFGNIVHQLFSADIGFVQLISIVCVVLYILSLLLDPSSLFQSSGVFNFLSPNLYILDKLGMTGSIAMSQGRWWTLITAIYLHGSLLHILFNILWIRYLGPYVEELYGTSRLIIIFTISGVLGFVASNFIGIRFTIGASGSIFGLLGALVYYGKDRGGVFGEAIFRQILSWAILLFVIGFFMTGINNFAHGGGFIGGYLSARLVSYNERKMESHVHKRGAAAIIVVTVISFLFAFWNAIF